MKLSHVLMAAAALGVVATSSAYANEEEIAKKSGCLACHTKDKKLVGPAYMEVAKKYKGQGDAPTKLAEKVRKGGTGVWGQIPMPPNDASKINDADLKAVIAWILKG